MVGHHRQCRTSTAVLAGVQQRLSSSWPMPRQPYSLHRPIRPQQGVPTMQGVLCCTCAMVCLFHLLVAVGFTRTQTV